jgi:hypothetical protein
MGEAARAIAPTKVVTGKVRGSYVNVFRPRLNDLSGQEEYSLSILIPKSDKATVGKIKAAIESASMSKWNGKPPANMRVPLRDGDAEKPDEEAYQNHYFINLKSKDKPGIVDKDRQEVLSSDEFMSGDYCRVSMNAFGYEQKGNRGVSFGLNNIQVIGKGQPLGGRGRAEDDFDNYEDTDGAPW